MSRVSRPEPTLPRGVSGPPLTRWDEVGDPEVGLPRILRELVADNDQRIAKWTQAGEDVTRWRGYQQGLMDVWRSVKHLYEEP